MTRQRILFGEQLGPLFDDGDEPLLLVESVAAFRKRPTHRQKAHLYLSALRHRAEELGARAELIRAGTFRAALAGRDLVAVDPPSYAARALVRELGAEVLPSRGFVTSEEDFGDWVRGRAERGLVMDTFYRWVREREGILMTRSGEPVGGRFSYDADNRQPPPKRQQQLDLPEPWWPTEDAIDEGVRRDLDRWEGDGTARFIGADGPRRFAVTETEARSALRHFVRHRLPSFGPYEDATLAGDWTMAHSLLSVPMNLGVLDPREVVGAALAAFA
ncbi:MAG: cryptochrome/photolyase family protein, partial [Acidobacteria bacterium]|nr:cryptochrome/photolyase family protein [Acidobacteriota bacterium]